MLDARLFVVTRDHERNGRRLGGGHGSRIGRIELRTDVAQARYESVLSQRLQSFYEAAARQKLASNTGQFAHDPIEAGLSLKADAWAIGQCNRAAFDFCVIGKATEIAEHAGIGFSAAETETGRNGQ